MTNKQQTIWNNTTGVANDYAKDPFGVTIYKGALGQEHSEYGFTLDHVWPESKDGSSEIENLQATSYQVNWKKADKMAGKLEISCRDNRNNLVTLERVYQVVKRPFYNRSNGKRIGAYKLKIEIYDLELNGYRSMDQFLNINYDVYRNGFASDLNNNYSVIIVDSYGLVKYNGQWYYRELDPNRHEGTVAFKSHESWKEYKA